jgi:transposase-like protein
MEQEKTNRTELMRAHIAACKASGKTVEDYCMEHELKASNYYYWRKKLQPPKSGKFIPITPLLSNAPVRITFTNGIYVSFEIMPPVDYVKQLVS